MAVSLKAEELFSIGNFSVTNSLLTGFVIFVLLIIFFGYYSSKFSIKPHSKLQLFLESIVLALHDLALGIMGEKATKTFFPIIFTFFVFIITSNWFGLLPFVGSIGYTHQTKQGDRALPILLIGSEEKHSAETEVKEITEVVGTEEGHKETAAAAGLTVTSEEQIEKPFFRSPSADLNFTLALAIISFILIQYAGLKELGLEYLGKFFDYRVKIPQGGKIVLLPLIFIVNFLWKTLELILEVSKIISFTFRLFGNIFAGEVLLFVMTSLTFGLLTLPFIGLELFVGFIQAIVFVFLTMVFIKVASESHHTEEEHTEHVQAA